MSISSFLLVFARLAALMLSTPLLGKGLPLISRGALIFALALAVSPLIATQGVSLYRPEDDDLLAQLVCEVGLGLLLGLLTRLILDLAGIAGSIISLPLGLSLSQILSNENSEQIVLSSQLFQTIAFLLLVSDNLFQRFIFFALNRSFILIPRASQLLSVSSEGMFSTLIKAFTNTFEQALLLALPLLLLLVLLFTAMGITSRIIPQLNLLIVGLPLQLALGLVFLVLLISPFSADMAAFFAHEFEQLPEKIAALLPHGGK